MLSLLNLFDVCQDDARQSTPVNNIVTSPLADAEESNNDEGISQSTEEDNPLANLISATLVDVHQNGDPVELNLADSVEVNQRSRFTDDLAVKRQASVPTIVVDICEDPVDQSDDESAEKSMNDSVDKTSDESAEETNDVTVALTNQNEEVVMETAAEPAVAVEPAEQSEIGVVAHSNIDSTNDVMADNIIVSTIKRENTRGKYQELDLLLTEYLSKLYRFGRRVMSQIVLFNILLIVCILKIIEIGNGLTEAHYLTYKIYYWIKFFFSGWRRVWFWSASENRNTVWCKWFQYKSCTCTLYILVVLEYQLLMKFAQWPSCKA